MSTEITLVVGGMHCTGCAQRAAAAARRLDGVVQATTDHATGQVRLVVDPGRVDAAAVAERLAAAGFEPVEPVEAGEPR
jgi:copper chaperone